VSEIGDAGSWLLY